MLKLLDEINAAIIVTLDAPTPPRLARALAGPADEQQPAVPGCARPGSASGAAVLRSA